MSCLQDHLLTIEWKDTCDVFFLTSAHEEEFVEALSSKVAHHKIKPTTVLDYRKYKIGVDRSDQMMSYCLLEWKMIKWWKKLFVDLFDLAVVIAHTLHTKTNNKKILPETCYKNLLKDCSLVLVEKFKQLAD
jgi:hypothetical protein